MNVVVMIRGREAIPVRAIPLLTDWEVLSPDELAGALTGDYPHNTSFEKLTARRLEDGHLKDVKPRLWSNVTVRQLEALSHRIKHKEISHDDGHEQWQRESLPLLPPGVFVWKDEFEACFWSAYGPDGETEWVAVEGGFKRRKRKEFIELDFEPLVSPEFSDLVMKGFEPQTTPSPAPVPQAAPVVAVIASGGTAVVWTTERKKAARAMMNEQRGQGVKAFAANTAAAFGVTATRLREVLNDKPKKAPAKKAKGIWDV